MNEKKAGGISVETKHIFPIIKKWLYSEKEIFLRELVSNACDAVTKLKRLSSLGVVQQLEDQFRITVTLDTEAHTLTVSDNGIGMTEEEVQNYICRIALSGALDFISKYEGENASGNGIIGHFGLGFYSAFMVADTVKVVTRSYTDAPTVEWVCDAQGEYEMQVSDTPRASRGTDVVLYLTEEEQKELTEGAVRDILDKYCAFMPVEIFYEVLPKKELAEGEEPAEEKPLNDTDPLWKKNAADCTREEYDAFYRKVFFDGREPLFEIHLAADYPLNFRGILYFPRVNHEYENIEGQVKLFYNQVFVADNIKEVIPEYLLMLKGVLDCPELPLNVSRSYLQNDPYVKKVSTYIVKKVADKLVGMFNTDRPAYEKMWEDIKLFVEYGAMRDHKFYERVKSAVLLPLTDGSFMTVEEYLEAAKEKNENTIYYATDKQVQAQYIAMFEKQGIRVAVLDKLIDTQFVHVLEQDSNVKCVRIDADVAEALRGEGEEYDCPALSELMKKVSANEALIVKYENLKDADIPAILNISEQSRRMEEMMKMYRIAGMGGMPVECTLVLNAASPLVRKLGDMATDGAEGVELVAKQMYTLALLSQRQLTAEELRSFLADSIAILGKAL